MKKYSILIYLWLVINGVFVIGDAAKIEPQVKQLMVLVRHGDRTPDSTIGESFPTDPTLNVEDDFFPVGLGALTNEGKLQGFNFGRIIKSKYKKFLEDIYYPSIIKGRSTDYDRTKMTLQLVLSGMFPPAPSQQWMVGVDWQPIPIEYFRREEDWVLRPNLCPKYVVANERYTNTSEYRTRVSELNDLTEYIEKVSGEVYETTLDLALLYVTLAAESAMGKEIPEWSKDIFPNGKLLDAGTFFFDIQNGNDDLRRLSGGMLLRKMIDDFHSYTNGTIEKGRKVFLYAAHDLNIAGFLSALKIWKSHMPAYSAAVVTELLEYNGEYFVKVNYFQGIPQLFQEMRIPGCDKLCPLDKFIDLLKNVTATDDDLKCA